MAYVKRRVENLLAECSNCLDLFSLPSGSVSVVLAKPSLLVRTLRSPERQHKLTFDISDDFPKKVQYDRVYLRVAKILRDKLVNDDYPDGKAVEVNGRSVGIVHEKCGPLDITGFVKMEVGSSNRIIVNFTPYLTNNFVATVFATTASGRLERDVSHLWVGVLLGEDQIQPPEITKNRILACFSKSTTDDDVRLENLEVKLHCPLTLKRLKHPCVSRKCRHVSCFDALGFLALRSPAKKCPICGVRCRIEDLCVDGYWVDVLRSIPRHCSKVILNRDGSWCAVGHSQIPKANQSL